LCDALAGPLNAVERPNIVKGAGRLLEKAFSTVEGERQCATAAVTKARNVMPRLQEIARQSGRANARCASAQIRDEIGKGHIRFVTDGRDDWGCRGGDSTQHPLNIERAEIVTRAPTARQEEHADRIGSTAPSLLHCAGINSSDRLGDLFGGTSALHCGMHDNEPSERRLAAQHPQHVVQDGTRSRGNQPDATRCMWDRSFARCVEEALCLQLALQRFKFAREKAHAAGPLHRCGDELITAPRAIEIDAATHHNDLADRWDLFAWANRAAEAHHIESGLFVT
jgi:hypothetical protein